MARKIENIKDVLGVLQAEELHWGEIIQWLASLGYQPQLLSNAADEWCVVCGNQRYVNDELGVIILVDAEDSIWFNNPHDAITDFLEEMIDAE